MIIIIPETTDTNTEGAGFHFNTEDDFFNYLYSIEDEEERSYLYTQYCWNMDHPRLVYWNIGN